MKRLIILILLLLCLSSVYFFLGRSEDKKMSDLKMERAFNIKDLDDLHKIIITQRNKKSIILEKQDDESWQLNSKYLARKNAVNNLLEVIEQVQIKYIPEKAANANIVKEMRTIGVQVDLYQKDNNLIKSYQVGGSTQDERGTYFLMNNSDQPFVMQIPSIEGSVRGRYIMSEIDWRDRAVINEEVDKLTNINVKYNDQPEESFEIKVEGEDQYELFSSTGESIGFDQTKVNGYLEGFDEVYAEYIDNLNPLRDSISSLIPFSTISYGAVGSDLKTIKLFPLSDLLYEDGGDAGLNSLKVEGRYFVDCSWGDFMLVQHRLIGKLLRGASYFEEK